MYVLKFTGNCNEIRVSTKNEVCMSSNKVAETRFLILSKLYVIPTRVSVITDGLHSHGSQRTSIIKYKKKHASLCITLTKT